MDTSIEKKICCAGSRVAAKKGHLDCLNRSIYGIWWHDNNIMMDISREGYYDCIVYACEKGHVPLTQMGTEMASCDHSECLKYYLGQSPDLVKSIMAKAAAINGSVDCLKILYEAKSGWPWWGVNHDLIISEIHPNTREFITNVSENWQKGIYPPPVSENIKG